MKIDPPFKKFVFAFAILDEALAYNKVPHVRTKVLCVDAFSKEHATSIALSQVMFECSMKLPQSAILHYRDMEINL